LSKGKKAIGCKWVYTKKQESLKDDTIRYKARLVVKGYAQQEALTTMRYSHLFKSLVDSDFVGASSTV